MCKHAEFHKCAIISLSVFWAIIVAGSCTATGQQKGIKTEEEASKTTAPIIKAWVDPATAHRVTRLSVERNSTALYFDQNAFSADKQKMIYTSPSGISMVDLATLESKLLVPGHVSSVVLGTKTNVVFYMLRGVHNVSDGKFYMCDLDSGHTTVVAQLPAHATIDTINADQTLAAGFYDDGSGPSFESLWLKAGKEADKNAVMHQRLVAKVPETLFTLSLKSGVIKTVLSGTDWLNHVAFSPTNPKLIMYAHEGPSREVDRLWLVDSNGEHNRLVHERTQKKERVTHEFWSPDGEAIWYEHQYSKSRARSLVRFDLKTEKPQIFHLRDDDKSLHYNISPDGKLFAADGTGLDDKNEEWDGRKIRLLRLKKEDGHDDGAGLERAGHFKSADLVDLSAHNYHTLEPGVRFTPDGSRVIFTSNMFGDSYVFAVEVKKEKTAKP